MRLPVNYEELTPFQRRKVREEYILRQNGKCWHCGNLLASAASDKVMKKWFNFALFPATFFKYPIHLHHDHKTKMTVGAVHCYCNADLWQYYGE